MQSFHEVLFPLAISFGATGGPERRNEIVALSSGREQRNARFQSSRRRYDAGTGLRSTDDLYNVIAFFEARRGSLHGFRFRDPFDMKSCPPGQVPSPLDQKLGTGDGTAPDFQLAKSYGTGADAYRREIAKPKAGSVRIAVNGAELFEHMHYAVDATTGIVTFETGAVPAEGATVTAGFEFDVPVRFDIDHLAVGLAAFEAGQIPSIPLVEIRP